MAFKASHLKLYANYIQKNYASKPISKKLKLQNFHTFL